MKTTFSILLLSAASFASFAQSNAKDLSLMMGKKWRTVEYGLAGQRVPAAEVTKEDGTVFQADGTYSSTDNGKASTGTWSYDAKSSVLSVHAEGQKETNRLLVLKLGETEAVMETMREHTATEAHADHSHEQQKMTLYLVAQ